MSPWAVAMAALALAVFMLALPLAYLGVLTLASAVRAAPSGVRTLRFRTVVPAHNEAGHIGETIASLLGQAYPQELAEVWVVADNCTDATAKEAEAAGARVLVRNDPSRRGKGYALDHAFTHLLADPAWDAVVVVDADTVVSAHLLAAYAARLGAGAQAIQADYGVRNPDASWRTRLMAVALGMFHRLRALGRSRLRLSVGLRGNGMCFARQLLVRHPHRAHGLVEDVEYGIEIGKGGVAVAYVDEARVLGEMVSGAKASRSQRQRWEGGRRQLLRAQLGPLVAAAWRQRSALLADLACDLLVPPLSTLGLALVATAAALAAAWAAAILGGQPVPGLTAVSVLWCVDAALLLAYVGRGAILSGLGWSALSALLYAPFYLAWKLALKLVPDRQRGDWVRTAREGEDTGAQKK